MGDAPPDNEHSGITTAIGPGSPGSPRLPHLVGIWAGGSVDLYLPARGAMVIGRSEGADIRIDHPSVSRRHACIRFEQGSVQLEDLSSANGTSVDGAALEKGRLVPIRSGALIEVGAAVLVLRMGDRAEHATANDDVVVADPQMSRVGELVDVVARSKLSVVLLGETGVGKEVLATRLHAQSPRAGGPFVKVNCAALVESLIEAELFGYERGAFTGAVQAKPGLMESASGGTLFLDEVGELPVATQSKLLRALECGEVTRVGGIQPRKLDVRIVAATNRDLRQLVAARRFREDLYFRLDGASIHVPPLRERRAEIPPLARLFVAKACIEAARAPLLVDDSAIERLLRYDWPGNIRELRNVVARSVVFCRSVVLGADDLQFDAVTPGVSKREPSDDTERRRIADALERAQGNQTRAAVLLGISRRTLLNRLDTLGMPRPRKRP